MWREGSVRSHSPSHSPSPSPSPPFQHHRPLSACPFWLNPVQHLPLHSAAGKPGKPAPEPTEPGRHRQEQLRATVPVSYCASSVWPSLSSSCQKEAATKIWDSQTTVTLFGLSPSPAQRFDYKFVAFALASGWLLPTWFPTLFFFQPAGRLPCPSLPSHASSKPRASLDESSPRTERLKILPQCHHIIPFSHSDIVIALLLHAGGSTWSICLPSFP